MIEAQFPAVSAGVAALPAIGTEFSTVADSLANEQDRFASADAIPTSWIPASSIPWGLSVVGIGIIVLGFMVATHRRKATFLTILLGGLLVVGSFGLSLPGKASDADTMNENLKPIYTAESIARAKAGLTTVTLMGAQLTDEMLPALALPLSQTPAEVNAFVVQQFPAVAGALQTLPATLGRFSATTAVFDDNLANFNIVTKESFSPVAWTTIFGGFVLIACGLLAMTMRRTKSVHMPREQRSHREKHAA